MKYSKESYDIAAEEKKQADKNLAKVEEEATLNTLRGNDGFVRRAKSGIQRRIAKSEVESKKKNVDTLMGLAEGEAHTFNEYLNTQAEGIITDSQELHAFFEINKNEISRVHEGILSGKIEVDGSGYPVSDDVGRVFLQQERVYRRELATKVESLSGVLKENYYNEGFIKKNYDTVRQGIQKDLEEGIRQRVSRMLESESVYEHYTFEDLLKKRFDVNSIEELAIQMLRGYEHGEPYQVNLGYGKNRYNDPKDVLKRFAEMVSKKTKEMLPLPESYLKLESLGKTIAIEMPLTVENADIESVMEATRELQSVATTWKIQNRG